MAFSVEDKEYLASMEGRIAGRLGQPIEAMGVRIEARLDQRIEALESRLDQRIEALESRLDQRIEAMEARVDQRIEALKTDVDRRFETMEIHVDQRIEVMETRLLTEFHKWASPTEAKLRSHSYALRSLDLGLEAVKDRLKELEQKRKSPPTP